MADPVEIAEIKQRLSAAREQNPYEPFSDESGPWNEGFCTAWEVVLAALSSLPSTVRGDGLEAAALWHDKRRRDTPDAFEMEFHEVSAAAIRALKGKPSPEGEGGEG